MPSKIIFALLFLMTVSCTSMYAKKRSDRLNDEQTEVDPISVEDEYKEPLTKDECYKKIFSENMYGFGVSINSSPSVEDWSMSIPLVANIPLSKEGPFRLDVELGFGLLHHLYSVVEEHSFNNSSYTEEYTFNFDYYVPASLLVQYVFSPKDYVEGKKLRKIYGDDGYNIRSYYLEAGPTLSHTLGILGHGAKATNFGGFVFGGGWHNYTNGGMGMLGLRLTYLSSLQIQIGANLTTLW